MREYDFEYTRGVDTPYPNKYSKKAYVLDGSIILNRPIVPFMKYRKYTYVFSLVFVGICLAGIFIRGLNLGLDFTGGTVVEVLYTKSVTAQEIKDLIEPHFPGIDVSASATLHDTTIRIPAKLVTDTTITDLQAVLSSFDPGAKITNSEYVGPKAGSDLVYASTMSLVCTIVMMLVYLSFRFQWKLSVGAVASLVHDTIITLGIFAIFQIDVDLNFVAAILSVVGYSINDTIVVYDRVRENIRKLHKADVVTAIDISLTETLSRTLLTSLTTLMVIVILYFFGGSSLHIFSLALIYGIFFGTYSSIYTAIAVALDLNLKKEDIIVKQVNKDGLDEYER